jgi:hypothetical protein
MSDVRELLKEIRRLRTVQERASRKAAQAHTRREQEAVERGRIEADRENHTFWLLSPDRRHAFPNPGPWRTHCPWCGKQYVYRSP